MDKKLELNLFENAIDSLNEALIKYNEGQEGNTRAFKFCILHLSQFFELILKYYITLSHPLLIYKNPFAKKICSNSFTIGLHEAINFLRNEGRELPEHFSTDVKWLKELRNDIEHYKFSMNVTQVQETIGRLMQAIVNFNNLHSELNLHEHIDDEPCRLFKELGFTYEEQLKEALQKVEDARENAYQGVRPKEMEHVNFNVYICDDCGHETMVTNEDSDTGYRCTFCGEEDSESIEIPCDHCGMPWPKFNMTYDDYYGKGHLIYTCPYCNRDPEYVKDND